MFKKSSVQVSQEPTEGILASDVSRARAILKETADSNSEYEDICSEISGTLSEMDKLKGSYGLEYTFKTFLSAFIAEFEKASLQQQNSSLTKIQELVAERVLASGAADLEKLFQKEIVKQQKQIEKETSR